MRDIGLMNPITVERNGERYRVIAGDLRSRAARQLGWPEILAIVREPADQRATAQMRLAENLQRTDLSPIEEAIECAKLHTDHGLDLLAISRLVRRSAHWVEQRMLLLHLPEELGPLVHTRKLAIGAALALARCEDAEHRAYLTQYALNEGATVHAIAMWIQSWQLQRAANPDAPALRLTPGEPLPMPIVLMPCGVCAELNDHRTMHILRTCTRCTAMIANPEHAGAGPTNSAAADQAAAGPGPRSPT